MHERKVTSHYVTHVKPTNFPAHDPRLTFPPMQTENPFPYAYQSGDKIGELEAELLNTTWVQQFITLAAPVVRDVDRTDTELLSAKIKIMANGFKLGAKRLTQNASNHIYTIAHKLAKQDLIALLNEKGVVWPDADIASRAFTLLVKNPRYLAQARRQVEMTAELALRELRVAPSG